MAVEMETSFNIKTKLSEKVTEFGQDKNDKIEVLTSHADPKKEVVLAKKQREARYLSYISIHSEASCRSQQVTRIEWNARTIFLLIFLIIVFLVIMFNIFIYTIFS